MTAPDKMWREQIPPCPMYPEGGAFYHETRKAGSAVVVKCTRADTIPDPMQDPRVVVLIEALRDAMSVLEYVNYHYGELHGVEFMRVRDASGAALSAITKEPPHER